MILKKIGLLVFSIIFLLSFKVSSQEQYRAEIGIIGGGAFYVGDANNQLFNNMQVSYGAMLRYKFNPRVAIKAELLRTSINGTFISDNATYILSKSINVGEIVGEFNFFDYEKNKNNRFSKIFSPFIFAGVGGLTGMYTGQLMPEFCIPFGVGMKLKIADRWNIHAQWSSKLLMNDNLEENVAPTTLTDLNNFAGLNGKNKFNNDLLTTLTIGVSFDIWKKECDCKVSSRTKNSRNKK